MQNFISALLGGLVVAAAFLFLAPEERVSLPVTDLMKAVAVEDAPDQVIPCRLDKLDDRLRKLEARDEPGTEQTLLRVPVEATTSSNLRTRVRALEVALTDLRQRVSLTAFEPPPIDDPNERRRVIEGLIGRTGKNQQYLGAVARIPMRVKLLEAWPRHERARQQLSELIDDYETAGQRHKAMATIDRFGPNTRLPDSELDLMRLRAVHRDSDRIEIARRVVGRTVDRWNRAWAMHELARGLAGVGRDPEALAAIGAMVGEFANTKEGRGFVANLLEVRKELLARR